MSAPPRQSQQSGMSVNDGSTKTNYTNNNGSMINVNGGGTINNLQITNNNSHQHRVNEPATGGEGIDEKCLDANDCVAQTTLGVTHSGKDEHGALYIPHDLIPPEPNMITLDHAKKYFDEYYRVFAKDTDVRYLFDNDKGFCLEYNDSHGEKFKYILTELHQLIKSEGQKLIGEHVVEGFNVSGFRVKSSSQGPTNVAQCLGIMKSPAMKEIFKNDPFFVFGVTYMYVHTTGLSNCYFVKTILHAHLKKVGFNHKPRFTFEEMVKVGNDGRKNNVNHNILKIGNLGTQQIRKDFQKAEMESFGMSIRMLNRKGSKKEKDHCLIRIDRKILSGRENCHGLPDPWLLVNNGMCPFTEDPTQAQLQKWLSHTEITRTAYQLVNSAQTESVGIEDVVAEVRKAFTNLKKSKLIGPSKPIVDNIHDICRSEDPTVIDNMLNDIGCPDGSLHLAPPTPSQHPPHFQTLQNQQPPSITLQQNQHSTRSQTLQNQTPGHASFHQNQHDSWPQDQLPPNLQTTQNQNSTQHIPQYTAMQNQQPPIIPLQQTQQSTHSQTPQNQTPGHISFQQNQHIQCQQDQLPPRLQTTQNHNSTQHIPQYPTMQNQQPPIIPLQQNQQSTHSQTPQNQTPRHISFQQNQHIQCSYLGSNGTSNNNGNMTTTERNMKESMGVASILQQMKSSKST